MSKSKTIACILASGTGERFGSFPPKQFQILWNKPLYMYTLEFLISSELFTDIEIMVRPEFAPQVAADISGIIDEGVANIKITFGSSERIDNINEFILRREASIDFNSVLAVFDANRPFVPIELLSELYHSCLKNGAACPARPVVDGSCYIHSNEIFSIPEKENLYSLQTPEFIRLDYYKKCLDDLPNNVIFKGVAELVKYSGNRLMFCRSDERCFKVTEPRDWVYAEFLDENKLI